MPIITNFDNDWMQSSLWTADVTPSRNAILVIRIRVWIVPLDSAAEISNATQRARVQAGASSERWQDGDLRQFKRDLKDQVEGTWSNRFWLVPERDWAGNTPLFRQTTQGPPLPTDVEVRPNIACRLVLEFPESRNEAHMWIEVLKSPEHPTYRRPDRMMRSGTAQPSEYSFYRSPLRRMLRQGTARTRMWLQTADVVERCIYSHVPLRAGVGGSVPACAPVGDFGGHAPAPSETRFLAAAHEFGHYLGLDHVDAARVDDPNSTASYSPTGTLRSLNILGHGSRLDPWNAYPWCRRLRQHLSGPHPAGNGWAGTAPVRWETSDGFVFGNTLGWSIAMRRQLPRTLARNRSGLPA